LRTRKHSAMSMFPCSLNDLIFHSIIHKDSYDPQMTKALRSFQKRFGGDDATILTARAKTDSLSKSHTPDNLVLDITIRSRSDMTHICEYFRKNVLQNSITCVSSCQINKVDYVVVPSKQCQILYSRIRIHDPDFNIARLVFCEDGSINDMFVEYISKDKYEGTDQIKIITKDIPCENSYVSTLSVNMTILADNLLAIGTFIGGIRGSEGYFEKKIS
jgi:hypothetical protein